MLFTDNTGGIELDEMECQDIDTPWDWKMAELKYAIIHGQANGDFFGSLKQDNGEHREGTQ
jgi:hypothetical protein